MKRRDLLRAGAIAGGSLLLPGKWALGKTPNRALNRAFGLPARPSPGLLKFIQPINGLGPTGIPVASPTTDPHPIPSLAYDYYRMEIGEYSAQLHPDLPKATKLWGYADASACGCRSQVSRRSDRGQKGPTGQDDRHKQPPPCSSPARRHIDYGGGDGPKPSLRSPAWGARSLDRRMEDLLPGLDLTEQHGESFMNPGPNPSQADYFYPNNQSARLSLVPRSRLGHHSSECLCRHSIRLHYQGCVESAT